MTPGAIDVGVEAEDRRVGDFRPGVDDRAANPAIPADLHPGHQDRILHFTVTVYTHARGKNAVHHAAAGDDGPGADHGIHGDAHAPAFLGEDEFGGRLLGDARADGPLLVVKVELGDHGGQVHIGFVIRIQGADVAPVANLLGVDIVEIVSDDAAAGEHAGDYIPAEIMAG